MNMLLDRYDVLITQKGKLPFLSQSLYIKMPS